jgi:transcriptional regulator with XRE-family HTH domain
MQGYRYSMAVPLQLQNWSIGRFVDCQNVDCQNVVGFQSSNLPVVSRTMSQSFGSRLRYERERRQIALKSIAEGTKIGMPLLEGLERDDVSRWPSGIFRKSFVRSYAEAIGLDPEPIVREFVERYPDPLQVESAAPVNPIRNTSPNPLSIKLTIAWSGSVQQTIGRLAEWKIVRMLLDWRALIEGFKSERI